MAQNMFSVQSKMAVIPYDLHIPKYNSLAQFTHGPHLQNWVSIEASIQRLGQTKKITKTQTNKQKNRLRWKQYCPKIGQEQKHTESFLDCQPELWWYFRSLRLVCRRKSPHKRAFTTTRSFTCRIFTRVLLSDPWANAAFCLIHFCHLATFLPARLHACHQPAFLRSNVQICQDKWQTGVFIQITSYKRVVYANIRFQWPGAHLHRQSI